MGAFAYLVVIAILLAFNIFAVDTILKLRTDVSVIRRGVYALRQASLADGGEPRGNDDGDDDDDSSGEATQSSPHPDVDQSNKAAAAGSRVTAV
jgi:hypothetical protein